MGNQGLKHNPGGEDAIQRVISKTLCTLDDQRVVGSTEKWELKADCKEMRNVSSYAAHFLGTGLSTLPYCYVNGCLFIVSLYEI